MGMPEGRQGELTQTAFSAASLSDGRCVLLKDTIIDRLKRDAALTLSPDIKRMLDNLTRFFETVEQNEERKEHFLHFLFFAWRLIRNF